MAVNLSFTVTNSNLARFAVARSVAKLEIILTPEHYNMLSHTTLDGVQKELLRVEELLARHKTNVNMRYMQPLLKWMDVYVSYTDWVYKKIPMSHWIWVPIKLVFMMAFNHREASQAVVQAYGKLSSGLPLVNPRISSFQHYPQLEVSLMSLLANILEVHVIFYQVFQQKSWKMFFHTTWSKVEKRFEAKLKDIHSDSQIIEDQMGYIDYASKVAAMKNTTVEMKFISISPWFSMNKILYEGLSKSHTKLWVSDICDGNLGTVSISKFKFFIFLSYSDARRRSSKNTGELSFDSIKGDWGDTSTLITDTSGVVRRNQRSVHKPMTVVGFKCTTSGEKFVRKDSFGTFEHIEHLSYNSPSWNSHHADIKSLVSENDNEMEKVEPVRWEFEERRYIETVIVKTLATNSSLSPSYEAALQLLPRDQFVNNFRRLLGNFRNDLLELRPDWINRELAAHLRYKDARTRIASRIRDERSGCDESHEYDLSRIERWLTKTCSDLIPKFPVSTDEMTESRERKQGKNIEKYGNDIEEEDRISTPFPRLDLVIQTLVQDQPFQNLILGFQQLLLPHGLVKDILPIPETRITFEPPPKPEFINTVQGWFETITAVEWDWWPLSPWLPPLGDDETRVYWRCVCGEMRRRVLKHAQRDILQSVLSNHPARTPMTGNTPEDHPSRLLRQPVCASLRPWPSKSTIVSKSQPSPRSLPKGQGQSYSFQSRLKSLFSHISNCFRKGFSGLHTSATAISVTASSTPKENDGKGRWLAFGVWGPHITVDLDQVDKHTLASDKLFLAEIKRRHDAMRGWLRLYFTFWRLSYWEFVKFTRLHGKYSAQTVELPTAPEYEYEPRPPEPPGVSNDTFEHLVNACLQPCWMHWLHTCWTIEDHEAELVGYLPKRETEFEFGRKNSKDRILWGLEARYRVVAWRIVVMHLAMLAMSFGLWGWWQRNHPDDLQGASTPLTVALLLMSMFWSTTGLLKPLR